MAKPVKTWILVADGTQARIMSKASADQEFTQLDPGILQGPNLQGREIVSDRPGRTFDSAGAGRHAKEPPTDPRHHQAVLFLKQLSERLEASAQKGEFERLVIVAPPRTLGDLRSALSEQVRAKVTDEVGKNLVHLTEPELKRRLAEMVGPWPA